MERLLSVKQLAELIGLSPATIYRLVERGEIPVQRVRRRVMFAPAAMERWLSGQARCGRDTAEAGSGRERSTATLRDDSAVETRAIAPQRSLRDQPRSAHDVRHGGQP